MPTGSSAGISDSSSGTRNLSLIHIFSHALLERFGSLAGVMDALPESLQQVPGVGEHTAVLLKLVPKLAGRYDRDRASLGTVLNSTRAAGEFLAPYFRQGARNEMVYLVCMDAKRKVLGVHKLGEGSVLSLIHSSG